MTNTEFIEIMKLMQIDDKDIYGNSYAFDNGKVIVSGKIPRLMIQELVSEDSRFENFLKQLSPKDGEKKYLSKFILGSKDELIMFLLSIDDFCLKEKTGLVGNSKDQYADILYDLYKDLMSRAKLDTSIISWFRSNEKINSMNFKTLERMNKRPLFKTKKSIYEQNFNDNIRRNIDNYDTSVNPYLLSENSFKKINEILESVNINIDIIDDDGASLEIIAKNNNNKVKYVRDKNHLLFEVTYQDYDDSIVIFAHEYNENAETITINRDGKKTIFNLTTGSINVNGYNEVDKDNKYKEKVYETVLTATVYATNVTDDNMLKKKYYSKK